MLRYLYGQEIFEISQIWELESSFKLKCEHMIFIIFQVCLNRNLQQQKYDNDFNSIDINLKKYLSLHMMQHYHVGTPQTQC